VTSTHTHTAPTTAALAAKPAQNNNNISISNDNNRILEGHASVRGSRIPNMASTSKAAAAASKTASTLTFSENFAVYSQDDSDMSGTETDSSLQGATDSSSTTSVVSMRTKATKRRKESDSDGEPKSTEELIKNLLERVAALEAENARLREINAATAATATPTAINTLPPPKKAKTEPQQKKHQQQQPPKKPQQQTQQQKKKKQQMKKLPQQQNVYSKIVETKVAQNRFDILSDSSDSEEEAVPKTTQQSQPTATNAPSAPKNPPKPPPIYIRSKCNSALVKGLIDKLGKDAFYAAAIKKGNVDETKVQVKSELHYRTITKSLEQSNTPHYTYQLKADKGLAVVLKGIDPEEDVEEIKIALIEAGFKAKSVTNMLNRNKAPIPLHRIELEPSASATTKGEIHPIYSLRLLMHRRVAVEEPRKRSGPVQCHNCQEFGHTRAYCKLPSTCVICGDLHATTECTTSKDDPAAKKCKNCGENHTANYRGCAVYKELLNRSSKPKIATKPLPRPAPAPLMPGFSFADAARTGTPQQAPQNVNANSGTNNNDATNTNSGATGEPAIIMMMQAMIQQLVATMTTTFQEMLNQSRGQRSTL